jgi:hypothetical protein
MNEAAVRIGEGLDETVVRDHQTYALFVLHHRFSFPSGVG